MHGGIFAPLTTLLAKRFRVHVVDLPGHGYASASNESIDPARCAASIAARVPRAIWAGWSFGGLVSLQAAL
jgi:pimeloyl-[acyl-carrier protein] methyl ester esterase